MKIALLVLELLKVLPSVIRAFKDKSKEDVKPLVRNAVNKMEQAKPKSKKKR